MKQLWVVVFNILLFTSQPLVAVPDTQGKIGIIGDSIAAGTHTSEMCRNQDIIDCIQDLAGQHSPEWSYAGGQQSWSLANLLGYPPDRVVDASDDGEEWKDAFDQAAQVMADPAVETVFIGLGANDICQGRGHDYTGDLEVVATLIDETLNYLTSTLPPGGSIYWSGAPDVLQMYELMRDRDHNLVFKTCQATWDINDTEVKDGVAEDACGHYFDNRFCDAAGGQGEALDLLMELLLGTWLEMEGVEEGPCGKILHSGSTDQDRLEAKNFTMALNRLMAQKAGEWAGRNGVNVYYNDRIYQASTTVLPHHLSRVDCYHPSRSGQMKFAYEIWGGFDHGYELPRTILLDEFDSVDYCTQEFSDWGNCWVETNDDGTAEGGAVRIVDNTLGMRQGAKYISRSMDLSLVDQAWLSFNRRRDDLEHLGDFVDAEVSKDGGLSWELLQHFVGEANDFGMHRGDYYDISAYATADTRIRYWSSSGMGDNDRLFFDNIKLNSWSTAATTPEPVYGLLPLDENWRPVATPLYDAAPLVFTGVATDSAGGAGVAAVRKVATNSFEIQLQEINSTASGVSAEGASYLVLQPGTYVMPDGSQWEVGSFDISADATWRSKSFMTPFVDPPHLFLSLQTENNPEVPLLRARSVDASGFEVALFEQVSSSAAGSGETAAYLAIHSPDDAGMLRINNDNQPYRLLRKQLDGNWTPVVNTFLRLRDGVTDGAQIDAETHDVLELGTHLFAQQVSSSGNDLAVPQRIAEGGAFLSASVLPVSRAVQVGTTATVFASIINAGGNTATDCGIAPLTPVEAGFFYQITGTNNALTGTPDTPVDIAAGGSQSYILGFTPTAAFSPLEVQFLFDCSNTDPAPVTPGVNTLLLSADNEPVPDIVAFNATASGDGILRLSNSGAFAVATINVGSGAAISVSADTGDKDLPLVMALCEVNGAGVCINPGEPTTGSVQTTMDANATGTFAVFVAATDDVPLDPANDRIFVRFKDSEGVTRGATSVAVQASLPGLP